MGLRTVLSRLVHWVRPVTHPTKPAHAPRLHVERLETREVPAAINEAFTASVIQGFLGRAADAPDLAFWDSRLATGETRTQMTAEIIASPEFQGRELQLLYQTLLGRPLDQVGLTAWGTVLRNGGTLDQVKAGILGSVEYFVRNGGTLPAWLNAIYQSQLGRPLDQPGQVFWTTQLIRGGLSREQVAAQILASDEANLDKIAGTYQEILGRPLDSAGVNFWGTFLRDGQTVESMFAGVAGSDEFLTRLEASLMQSNLADPNQAANQFLFEGNRFSRQLPGLEVLDRLLPTLRSVNTLTAVIPTATGVATAPTTSVLSTLPPPITAGVTSGVGAGTLVTSPTSFATPGVTSGTPFGAGTGTTIGMGTGASFSTGAGAPTGTGAGQSFSTGVGAPTGAGTGQSFSTTSFIL